MTRMNMGQLIDGKEGAGISGTHDITWEARESGCTINGIYVRFIWYSFFYLLLISVFFFF
jgi:hypothetical protein